MQIDLTKNEIEVLDDYVDRKLMKLEQSGLTDSKCYLALYSVHRKLVKAKNYRPQIGDEVYIIYEDCITKVKVIFVNDESFVMNEAFDACFVEDYRRPYKFTEEHLTWTRTLNEAKKIIRNRYSSFKIRFVKFKNEDHWEAVTGNYWNEYNTLNSIKRR